MSVSYNTQDPSDIIHIRETSIVACAARFGAHMKTINTETLTQIHRDARYKNKNSYKLAKYLYAAAKKLAVSDIFVVNGVNWLERYLIRLEAYCRGSGIPMYDGVLMQLEIESGCQSMIVMFAKSGRIHCLHTEENTEDPDLQAYYSNNSHINRYRIVHENNGGQIVHFFAYPGLCWGGPAVGLNNSHNMFMAVDSLQTVQTWSQKLQTKIWHNAMASMIFDMSTPGLTQKFLSKLKRRGIQIYDGYAMHLAFGGISPKLESFEIGGSVMSSVRPHTYHDKVYYVQANLPRTKTLLYMDERKPPTVDKPIPSQTTLMLRLEMLRRSSTLNRIARQLKDYSLSKASAKLLHIVSTPGGDIDKTTDGRYAFTGFISPYLAGYATTVLDKKAKIVVFGMKNPKEILGLPHRYWFDPIDPVSLSYKIKNLWEMSGQYRRRLKKTRHS